MDGKEVSGVDDGGVEGRVRVVDQDIDFLEVRGQVADKGRDLFWFADIEPHGVDFDAVTDLLLDLLGQLLERFEATRSHNEFEVLGRRPREF